MATRKRTAAPSAPPPSSGDARDPAAQVLRRFRLVFNAVKSHFQQVEKQAGIGGAQIWALSVIAAAPDIGIGGPGPGHGHPSDDRQQPGQDADRP